MHVRAITPIHISATELARRQARYDKLAPPGIDIQLENLPDRSDVPRQLASTSDIAASDAAVRARLAELDPATVDVALPDCVLDPGLEDVEALPVPAAGITQLSSAVVAALGAPFTAVARNRAIADELDRIIGRYGYRGFEPTRVLDLSFEAIADHEVWNDAAAGMATEFAGTGIRHVLNGCSAVEIRGDDIGVVVFDPTRLALQTLGLAADNGLIAARRETQEVRE